MLSLIAFAANVATLTMPERAAIFVGAGATKRGARWMICKEDLNASARIDQIEDLNGDGRPEAVVGEDGTYCYGGAGDWRRAHCRDDRAARIGDKVNPSST